MIRDDEKMISIFFGTINRSIGALDHAIID
jgi:hypothetical protein